MPVQTSVFTADFSRCLVNKTTAPDKQMLVQWIYAMMSVNRDVTSMSAVSASQRAALHAKAAKLLDRLVTVDCRKEAVAAIKYDGPQTIEVAFELVGKVAMQEFMAEKSVAAELGAFAQSVDKPAWEAVLLEAGIKVPAKAGN